MIFASDWSNPVLWISRFRRLFFRLLYTEMISVGQKSLTTNGFSFFVFGFYTVYSSLFLALGKGTAGFVLGACRQGICFVPIILLLPSFWGINGILYAQLQIAIQNGHLCHVRRSAKDKLTGRKTTRYN